MLHFLVYILLRRFHLLYQAKATEKIDIQLKVVKQVEEIGNQAKKIKADATAVLDNAKAEVEKMILG